MNWLHYITGRLVRNLILLLCFGFAFAASACIWDGDTLEEDIQKNPKLADAILNPRPPASDQGKLNQRLKELLANPKEDDPDWWNNVAGTYLRLGQAAEAVKLLEPVVGRFEYNYGIHANLGTAYHLLGRYAEAEKEIARDLELNPEAHFGLEKYHLALLQYLAKPKDYQARHLYVDEFTGAFYDTQNVVHLRDYQLMNSRDENTSPEELKAKLAALTGTSAADQENRVVLLRKLAAWDTQPNYTSKHELAEDPKFQEGVIYMATLNPKEPACMTMLGMAALKSRDLNLAQKAFEKALLMGSPMEDALTLRITTIQEHIKKADGHSSPPDLTALLFGLTVLVIAACACLWILIVIGKKLRKAMTTVVLLGFGLCAAMSQACVWDSDTLLQEKWHSPKLADAILKPQIQLERTRPTVGQSGSSLHRTGPLWQRCGTEHEQEV